MTVDLLTTGIDVPEIVNLVFLRRVRSRILYEQMLGRATRLPPEGLDKEFFTIFDAVDLYTEMQNWTAMKPVVTNPSITYAQLAAELQVVTQPEHVQVVAEQFTAKMQWTSRRMKPDQAEAFALVRMGDGPKLLVSDHPDQLVAVERGYGTGQKPRDYLDGFRQFVLAHQNDIAALKVVMTRPRDLTRRDLKALALRLDQAGYPVSALRTAWQDLTNQDIAASLIGFSSASATR